MIPYFLLFQTKLLYVERINLVEVKISSIIPTTAQSTYPAQRTTHSATKLMCQITKMEDMCSTGLANGLPGGTSLWWLVLYKNVRKATYTLGLRVCVLTIKNMSQFVQGFLCNGRFCSYSQLHNNVQTRMDNLQFFITLA